MDGVAEQVADAVVARDVAVLVDVSAGPQRQRRDQDSGEVARARHGSPRDEERAPERGRGRERGRDGRRDGRGQHDRGKRGPTVLSKRHGAGDDQRDRDRDPPRGRDVGVLDDPAAEGERRDEQAARHRLEHGFAVESASV